MYRTICTELWTDPKVQALSIPSNYLFLYLITNPHSHLSGLYYLPRQTMALETRLERGIDGALKGLLASKLVEYDTVYKQVWILNMFKFQGRGQKTERGVASYLHTMHSSPLIARFLLRYPQVESCLPPDFERCPIDTPSMGGVAWPSPSPDPSSVPNSEGEKILKKRGAREIEETDGLTEKHRALAQSLGIDPAPEWANFKNYCKAHGKRYVDYEAAFRNWLVKAPTMNGGKHVLREMRA